MPIDTLYRHQQALDPSALTIITGAAHAVSAAIADCYAAGKEPNADAAVILLARHLGRIAAALPSGDTVLRRRCAEDIAVIRGGQFATAGARRLAPASPNLARIAA